MRFKFTADVDVPFKTAKGTRAVAAYKAGTEATIPQAHADYALEKKAGHVVDTPNRDDAKRG